ncbi:hypothetical protein SprV_1002903700 [Sparganum proliferum]
MALDCVLPKLIAVIKAYYCLTTARVLVLNNLSQQFGIRSDVRQGCILKPSLFNYAIRWIRWKALHEVDGVEFAPGHRLTDLDYADDIALLASSFGDLQSMMSGLNSTKRNVSTAKNFSLASIHGEVDIMLVKKDMLQHFHSLLNSVFPDIKFTREEEQEQQLPSLDVLVRRNLNGELETAVYRKATNTTQLLSFHSNHPISHKRSCAKTLFKRVQTHCSKPEDRAREARYLRDQFVQNGYPRAFLSRCIRGRHQRTRASTPPTIWHSLPYIKGVSEATERIAAELGVGIAHRPKATMRNRVMKIKDRLKPEEQSLVVYRIPCQNCPCNYTGQTGRMLGSRIHEHKLAVRRGDALSQVAAHTYEMGHELNFAATKIVAHAGNKTGRELIEAWASDENSVNRFIDLAPAYRALHSHLQACDVGR